MQMGRVDGFNKPSSTKKDTVFTWTNVYETKHNSPTSSGIVDSFSSYIIRILCIFISWVSMFVILIYIYTICAGTSAGKSEASGSDVTDTKVIGEGNRKYRKAIFGEEALTISSKEPYSIHHPIRRGHFNVSQQYSAQEVYIFLLPDLCRWDFLDAYLILSTFQVYEDLIAILDWILVEKLHIVHSERGKFSAVLIVPETFDSRGKHCMPIAAFSSQFHQDIFLLRFTNLAS